MGFSGRVSGTIALIAGGIFYQISFTNLAVILPLINGSLHLGGTQGIVLGAFPLGAAALFIPAGFIALRLGVRSTLLIGLVIEGGSGILSALSQNAAELTLLRFMSGAGGALFYAPAVGLLASLYPVSSRAVVIGAFASLSIAVGATTGFVGGAYLGLAFGWRFVLAVFGVGALGVAAIGVLSVPSTPMSTPPATLVAHGARFLEVVRSPVIWSLSLGASGLLTAGYLGPAFLSSFVKAAHPTWGLDYAGAVAAIAFVSTIPGALLAGRWSEQGQDRRVWVWIPAVLFGGLFLLIPVAGKIELPLLFAVLGFLGGAALAVVLTMPSHLPATRGERTPTAIGIVESVEGFARFGGAAVFGAVEIAGGFGWSWTISGLLVLGTLPFLLGVPPNRRRLQEETREQAGSQPPRAD